MKLHPHQSSNHQSPQVTCRLIRSTVAPPPQWPRLTGPASSLATPHRPRLHTGPAPPAPPPWLLARVLTALSIRSSSPPVCPYLRVLMDGGGGGPA